jgi:hypothetical protein
LPFCNADLIAHPDTLAHMQCLVIQYAWWKFLQSSQPNWMWAWFIIPSPTHAS